jgi:hypothetical protein
MSSEKPAAAGGVTAETPPQADEQLNAAEGGGVGVLTSLTSLTRLTSLTADIVDSIDIVDGGQS